MIVEHASSTHMQKLEKIVEGEALLMYPFMKKFPKRDHKDSYFLFNSSILIYPCVLSLFLLYDIIWQRPI